MIKLDRFLGYSIRIDGDSPTHWLLEGGEIAISYLLSITGQNLRLEAARTLPTINRPTEDEVGILKLNPLLLLSSAFNVTVVCYEQACSCTKGGGFVWMGMKIDVSGRSNPNLSHEPSTLSIKPAPSVSFCSIQYLVFLSGSFLGEHSICYVLDAAFLIHLVIIYWVGCFTSGSSGQPVQSDPLLLQQYLTNWISSGDLFLWIWPTARGVDDIPDVLVVHLQDSIHRGRREWESVGSLLRMMVVTMMLLLDRWYWLGDQSNRYNSTGVWRESRYKYIWHISWRP